MVIPPIPPLSPHTPPPYQQTKPAMQIPSLRSQFMVGDSRQDPLWSGQLGQEISGYYSNFLSLVFDSSLMEHLE